MEVGVQCFQSSTFEFFKNVFGVELLYNAVLVSVVQQRE